MEDKILESFKLRRSPELKQKGGLIQSPNLTDNDYLSFCASLKPKLLARGPANQNLIFMIKYLKLELI